MKFLVATIVFMFASLPVFADEATRLAIASAQSQVAALESAGITREENPDAWEKADAIMALVSALPAQETLVERIENAKIAMETDPDFSFADSLRVYDESMMGQSTGAQTPEEIEEREALGILIAEQKEVHRIAMLEAQRASLDAILNPAPVTSEEAE